MTSGQGTRFILALLSIFAIWHIFFRMSRKEWGYMFCTFIPIYGYVLSLHTAWRWVRGDFDPVPLYAPPGAAQSTAGIQAPSLQPAPTEDERLAREAAAVHEKWEQEQRAIEAAHRDQMLPIHQHLAKARRLVEASGVGSAACDILRIAWHWPSWSKRPEWKAPLQIDELTGGDIPKGEASHRKGRWIGWVSDGDTFKLELTVIPGHDGGDPSGALTLSVRDEVVMQLDVSNRSGEEYDRWNVFGVSVFKAGPWMVTLNDIAGRLRIADGQFRRDRDLRHYGQKASGIKID